MIYVHLKHVERSNLNSPLRNFRLHPTLLLLGNQTQNVVDADGGSEFRLKYVMLTSSRSMMALEDDQASLPSASARGADHQ